MPAGVITAIAALVAGGVSIWAAAEDKKAADKQFDLTKSLRAEDLALARQTRADTLRQNREGNKINARQVAVQEGTLALGQQGQAFNQGIKREELNKAQVENWGSALARMASTNAQFKNWLISLKKAA